MAEAPARARAIALEMGFEEDEEDETDLANIKTLARAIAAVRLEEQAKRTETPEPGRNWEAEVCAIAHALGIEHTPEGHASYPGDLPSLLSAIKRVDALDEALASAKQEGMRLLGRWNRTWDLVDAARRGDPQGITSERVQTMLEDARSAIHDELYSVAVDHIDAAIRALETDEKGGS